MSKCEIVSIKCLMLTDPSNCIPQQFLVYRFLQETTTIVYYFYKQKMLCTSPFLRLSGTRAGRLLGTCFIDTLSNRPVVHRQLYVLGVTNERTLSTHIPEKKYGKLIGEKIIWSQVRELSLSLSKVYSRHFLGPVTGPNNLKN